MNCWWLLMLEKIISSIGNFGTKKIMNCITHGINDEAAIENIQTIKKFAGYRAAINAADFVRFEEKSVYADIMPIMVEAAIRTKSASNMYSFIQKFSHLKDTREICLYSTTTLKDEPELGKKLFDFYEKNIYNDELRRYAKILSATNNKSEVLDFFSRNANREGLNVVRSLIEGIKEYSDNVISASLELFDKYMSEKRFKKLGLIYRNALGGNTTEMLVKVIDKYYEHLDDFYQSIDFSNRIVESQLRELLTDKAYEAINKCSNKKKMFRRLITKDYSFRESIKAEVSYDDLDVVDKTWDQIHAIYMNKDLEYTRVIRKGFYSELNRAISQGDVSKNLRQYCKEVRDKIREHADELMVITDG